MGVLLLGVYEVVCLKTRSAKNKGKRLQNDVRDMFLRMFPELTKNDVRSTIMGESGTDLKFSEAAKAIIPFDIECKNTESLNFWAAIKQAEANTEPGRVTALIVKKNNTEAYLCVPLKSLRRS